jgi:two-component system, NtrC family, response regulator AtoC
LAKEGDMAKEKILIVDDEWPIRFTLSEALQGWGYQVLEADTVAAALTIFEVESPVFVLLDINLPDGSGLDVLREIKKRQPDSVVIMITSEVVIGNILEALRGGAYDFISKPVRLEELQVTIHNAIEAHALRKEVHAFRRERASQFSFEQIIGESPALGEVIQLARKVAQSGAMSVLLQGESGTGKDLIAKAIHYASRRANKPLVAINCAAIPAALLESELFGYEKGAFTDAKARKEGLFEQAEGGTLFLDEIGELELSLQAKLLRVLEEGVFRRVGGLKDIALDVRVLAASNRNLRAESEAERFRLDLYYRLSVIQVDIPPLRARQQDVMILAEYYIKRFNRQFEKQITGLSPEVREIFGKYLWPGNVRELRNVIERLVILEEGDVLTTKYLPHELQIAAIEERNRITRQKDQDASHIKSIDKIENNDENPAASPTHTTGNFFAETIVRLPPTGIALENVEMSLVKQALELSHGNQTHAAKLLSITREQLRYRMKKLDEMNGEINQGEMESRD